MAEPEKNPRKRKQKEQDAQELEDREHKRITQAGVPKDKEKGKKDKGDEKKQQEGATKTNKDEKQGEAANKQNGNRHKDNKQTKGCQPQFKNIHVLLAVCVCATAILAGYAWQVDSQYRTEVALLQKKVEEMEMTIKSNGDMLATHDKKMKSNGDMLATHDKKIKGLTDSVKNAATKQEVSSISSKIAQLDTKIERKCKGH